jgi:hypothetical protein
MIAVQWTMGELRKQNAGRRLGDSCLVTNSYINKIRCTLLTWLTISSIANETDH